MVVFLIATAGLLGWALIRPCVDKVRETRYTSLPAFQTGRGFGHPAVDEQETGAGRRERPRDDEGVT